MGHPTDRFLRIGIDGRTLAEPLTGVGRYTTEICKRLHGLLPNATFYIYAQRSPVVPVAFGRWIVKVDPSHLAAKMKPILWLKTRAGRLCRPDRLDAFWGSATFLPNLRPAVRLISTVNDLNYRVVPETLKAGFRIANKVYFARDAARADRLICISQGSADRLRRFTGLRCEVIARPGVGDAFRPHGGSALATCLGQYGIDFRYLLAVATWEPRKNLGMLVETFLAMKRDRELGGRKLVLVGGRGWKDRRLASLVDSAGKSAICCPGYVPDEDLPAIYSGADAFIFPSQYEGFGIPVSEARACGTRVVASDIPEIREAGGPDPEVIYVQPTSQGLREGIEKILGREGTEPAVRPERPGWDAAAQIYAEALAGSR